MSDEMTSATFTEQEWSHFESKTLNEECGLFGVWGHPDAARLTYFGLHALQHRGQEGAGILVNNNGKLNRHRGLGLVTEVFRDEKDLEELTGSAAIGHVRYARLVQQISIIFSLSSLNFMMEHLGLPTMEI